MSTELRGGELGRETRGGNGEYVKPWFEICSTHLCFFLLIDHFSDCRCLSVGLTCFSHTTQSTNCACEAPRDGAEDMMKRSRNGEIKDGSCGENFKPGYDCMDRGLHK